MVFFGIMVLRIGIEMLWKTDVIMNLFLMVFLNFFLI